MRVCKTCGQRSLFRVPPGMDECIDCMDDMDVARVDLDLVARELEATLAAMDAVERPAWMTGGDFDGEREPCTAGC